MWARLQEGIRQLEMLPGLLGTCLLGMKKFMRKELVTSFEREDLSA